MPSGRAFIGLLVVLLVGGGVLVIAWQLRPGVATRVTGTIDPISEAADGYSFTWTLGPAPRETGVQPMRLSGFTQDLQVFPLRIPERLTICGASRIRDTIRQQWAQAVSQVTDTQLHVVLPSATALTGLTVANTASGKVNVIVVGDVGAYDVNWYGTGSGGGRSVSIFQRPTDPAYPLEVIAISDGSMRLAVAGDPSLPAITFPAADTSSCETISVEQASVPQWFQGAFVTLRPTADESSFTGYSSELHTYKAVSHLALGSADKSAKTSFEDIEITFPSPAPLTVDVASGRVSVNSDAGSFLINGEQQIENGWRPLIDSSLQFVIVLVTAVLSAVLGAFATQILRERRHGGH